MPTDPLTGLDLSTLTDQGYQIPLNSIPVPLSDLNAKGKQTGFLYPDNVPPVLANLNAMDSTNPLNAQTLQTDGAHRLLVNTGQSGGGGGSEPVPTIISSAEYASTTTDGDIWLFAANWAQIVTLYRLDFWAEVTGTLTAGQLADIYFGLTDNGSDYASYQPWILHVGNGTSGMSTGLPYVWQTVTFGGGLNVQSYLGTTGPGCYVYANNKPHPVRVGCALYGATV